MYESIYITGGRRRIEEDVTLDWQMRLNDHFSGPFGAHHREDPERWSQIVSAWYGFEDSYEALSAYLAVENPGNIDGLTYLLIRGVLQEMNIQQDALRHLAQALDFSDIADDVRRDSTFRRARDIRIRVAGHPTRRDARPKEGEPVSFHGLVRIQMRIDQFKLARFEGAAATPVFETVDVVALVRDHLETYRTFLRRIVERIDHVASEG